MDDKKQPIVIKRIKKGGHAAHGGAWKVAYADFVTAMMAFFLLMWLLGSTTKAQKRGISDWFQNPTGIQGPGGASTSMIQLGGAMDMPTGEGKKTNQESPSNKVKQRIINAEKALDKHRLDALMQQIKKAIDRSQALKPFKDQLLLDITPEGLRIQIVDKENRPMFDSGSPKLKWYTTEILHEIGKTINQVPNKISITGHTDATPYSNAVHDYTNWELSADRANAARRALIAGGMNPDKVAQVVGLASTVLFDKANPFSPINRRISIIVMNKATEKAIRKQGRGQSVPTPGPSVPAPGSSASTPGLSIPTSGPPVPAPGSSTSTPGPSTSSFPPSAKVPGVTPAPGAVAPALTPISSPIKLPSP